MLYIPYSKTGHIGGPSTFIHNFLDYLDSINYKRATKLEKAKVIFVMISYDTDQLKKFKNKGGKVILRLDGVYNEVFHPDTYKEMNHPIMETYKLADHIIFQSDYSRKQCFDKLGQINPEKYSIIHNGTNTKLFRPQLKIKDNGNEFTFITTGVFRRNVMLEPIVKALDILYQTNKNIKLITVGPLQGNLLPGLLDRPYIISTIAESKLHMAELLQKADIFIHCQPNDNCPNAVVEAISAGLPIVGFTSGGLSELCYFNHELLVQLPNQIYHYPEQFKEGMLFKKLQLCMDQYDYYKKNAIKYHQNYSMALCSQMYISVLEKVMTDLNKWRSSFKNILKSNKK